jgi:hypothetical protein
MTVAGGLKIGLRAVELNRFDSLLKKISLKPLSKYSEKFGFEFRYKSESHYQTIKNTLFVFHRSATSFCHSSYQTLPY